jgi:hypothetical protein
MRGSELFRVFRLRLFQDGDVGVSIFPQGEEVLIGGFCFGGVALHGIGSTQLEMSQYADGIADHDPGVIENFLKFPGGFSALARGQIRLPTRIDGIEGAEETGLSAARLAQFIGNGDLEKFDGLCGIAMVQREKRSHGWQVIELNRRIFGEAAFQIVGQGLSLRRTPAMAKARAAPYCTSRFLASARALIAAGFAVGAFP